MKPYTILESYKTYNGPVPCKKYTAALKDIFREISFAIIREKFCYFPTGLGRIFIRRKQVSKVWANKRKVDYDYYNKTKTLRTFDNLHTDGYYFRYWWTRVKKIKGSYNLRFYKFRPIRGADKTIGKRGLAKWIKECSINPLLKDYTTV